MASVPTTLEEVQRDVLTKDLSSNPFMQSSPIPSKDNALRTISKKIVGAINEIKTMLDINSTSLTLFAEGTDQRLGTHEEAIDDLKNNVSVVQEDVTTIQEQIENGLGGGPGEGTGGGTKVKLIAEVELEEKKIWNFPDDFEPNWPTFMIIHFSFDRSTQTFKRDETLPTIKTSGTSVYEISGHPYEMRYNPTTKKYFLCNTSSRKGIYLIYQ